MDPSKMSAQEVKDALLQAGMFAFIRQRPYDVIADPTVTPKAIFISLSTATRWLPTSSSS